jgi:hypothetical protein
MQQASDQVTVTQTRTQCRHIHAAGNQCGSPALRHEQFCYFHHATRRPKPPAGKFRFLDSQEPFELPVVEDRASALSVAAQVLARIASNDLDYERAGRILYNLQILISLMPKEPRPSAAAQPAPSPVLIEELVYDETHGFIAPIKQLVEADTTDLLDSGHNAATLPAPQSATTVDLEAAVCPQTTPVKRGKPARHKAAPGLPKPPAPTTALPSHAPPRPGSAALPPPAKTSSAPPPSAHAHTNPASQSHSQSPSHPPSTEK